MCFHTFANTLKTEETNIQLWIIPTSVCDLVIVIYMTVIVSQRTSKVEALRTKVVLSCTMQSRVATLKSSMIGLLAYYVSLFKPASSLLLLRLS